MTQTENFAEQKSRKLLFLFTIFVFLFCFFLFSVYKIIHKERRLPTATTTIHDRSLRGNIISSDGYTLARSKKSYEASVRVDSIDPDKKELFIKLFSLYSDIPEAKIKQRFKDNKGNEIKKGTIILSRNIDARNAAQLKSLAYKLRRLDVFQSIKLPSGVEILYGLDVIENGESRIFPLFDVAAPVLGYVGDLREEDGYIRPIGKQGLERYYNKYIAYKQNGYLKGKRDVVGALIQNNESQSVPRINGLDLHLNISLSLQRRIEVILDSMKKELEADEILAGIIESKSGKVFTLASSNRYTPNNIKQKDIPVLNPNFAEYLYEPGSVIKPLTLAIAMQLGRVKPESEFELYGGTFKIGKYTITDDHKFDKLSAADIVAYSSNIGITQIAWLLSGKEFHDGLQSFGLSKPTGIDLARDLSGNIKSPNLLNHKIHSANSSYGYGSMVSFMQLLKAYTAFNNEGVIPTPRIAAYLEDVFGKHYTLPPTTDTLRPMSADVANTMKMILIRTVEEGTGKKAIYPGLEVGGKTGTAHIAKDGKYTREYQSSFFGFVNDKYGNKYTVGVFVIKPKKKYHYFAAQSAVPVFKKMVKSLVDLSYLSPEKIETSPQIKEEIYTDTAPAQPLEEETKPQTKPKKEKPLTPQDLFKNI
ncbi:MAG: penicillin-binding protein 2 [Campylobacterales bacterium]|nr:penicillin-binding protein 2 [Campylobacterales bacterium]